MPSMPLVAPLVPIALCSLAVVALIIFEKRQDRVGLWIAKPIASAAFVVAALGQGALRTPYGTAILTALLLSMAGDILLIPKATLYFRLGLATFLLGHVAFGVAFLRDGVSFASAALAALPLTALAVAIGRWVFPHVPSGLRIPVTAYVVVITAMVALAAGHYAEHGRLLIPVAAATFFVSDLSVARDRFVAPGFINRAWGLPVYYLAQMLFALSV